jgi:uncharacterized protein with von Willebrand factor type A (vWA) domain
MQATMENFLRALRAAEVRVSPAEAIDAHLTVDAVGYADRQLLKDALCVTLAKSEEEVARFDDCFEMFFHRDEFRSPDEDVTGGSEDTGGDDQSNSELLGEQPLAQMLLSGDGEAMAREMESAANDAGAANIRFFSQRGYFARRILDQMGLRDLERLIAQLNRGDGDGDGELAERLEAGRRYLLAEARAYVERQYELYARANGENLRDEFLSETRLTALEHRDFARMHKIVRRMAKRLASRYSRRLKHSKRGRLDVRRTLRRSMAHEAIPFETVWKQEYIDKPRIVVICDVSRSVAAAARFLLLLVYSLNEVIAKLNSFAFSDRLIEISDSLDEHEVEQAIPEILERIGFRPTDYGQALDDLAELFLDKLDRKTTVIMLGDGRSNFTDPRLDLMRQIHDRSKAVIWLNPEPESFWGQGDSEMHKYRRFCHIAKTCSTITDLERIIDDVLKSYIRH